MHTKPCDNCTRLGGRFYGDSRTVDVHIRWLREKLEHDPANPVMIHTVRGIGYRFQAAQAVGQPSNVSN